MQNMNWMRHSWNGDGVQSMHANLNSMIDQLLAYSILYPGWHIHIATWKIWLTFCRQHFEMNFDENFTEICSVSSRLKCGLQEEFVENPFLC